MFSTTNLYDAVKRLNEAYEQKWHNWLPETLKSSVENRWGTIDGINFERLLAIRNLLNYKFFWHDADVFEATINALNWIDSDHRVAPHPSPAQIVWGVDQARKISIVEDENNEFGDEVMKYIASVFINRDLIYLPKSFGLEGTQEYLDIYFKDSELKKIVEVQWKAVMDGEDIELEESPVGVQIAKLLVIKRFVDMGGVASPDDHDSLIAKLILG